ncbi:hypothetical protein [Gordonia malaquae]|uniref:hypothetical protein n=1 Tax=Gordonia malaquae TaxID=410332 RepID=UPI0012FB2C49|nr:hypothetical protein [Gordonia malaquae]
MRSTGKASRSPRERDRRVARFALCAAGGCVLLGIVVLALAFGLSWPWWARLVAAVVATAAALLGWASLDNGLRPFPAIYGGPRPATITGMHTDGPRTLFDVRVDTARGSFESVIADRVHVDDRHRFSVGSQWEVYEFAASRTRVILTGAHDDVRRYGYDLGDVRGFTDVDGTDGYGSEIVARGFRDRLPDLHTDHPTAADRARPNWGMFVVTLAALVSVATGLPAAAFLVPWPWWAQVLSILAVGAAGVLAWMEIVGNLRPFPAIYDRPRSATVTGVETVGDGDGGSIELFAVRVEEGGVPFDSVLADYINPDQLHRFSTGTRWQVYEFADSSDRVILTEAHDDVLRDGYDLSGVRWGREFTGGTGFGSAVLARGFRARLMDKET